MPRTQLLFGKFKGRQTQDSSLSSVLPLSPPRVWKETRALPPKKLCPWGTDFKLVAEKQRTQKEPLSLPLPVQAIQTEKPHSRKEILGCSPNLQEVQSTGLQAGLSARGARGPTVSRLSGRPYPPAVLHLPEPPAGRPSSLLRAKRPSPPAFSLVLNVTPSALPHHLWDFHARMNSPRVCIKI